MPTYDYDCTDCGAEVEIFHGINETKRKCPSCGKLKLKRAWREVAAFHNQLVGSDMTASRNGGARNATLGRDGGQIASYKMVNPKNRSEGLDPADLSN